LIEQRAIHFIPRLVSVVAFVLLVAFPALARDGVNQEIVVYAAPDGFRLHMTVFTPVEEDGQVAPAPRPAVLLIHGGAWVVGRRHQLFWLARMFAEQGVVAASMDYRKLPQYGFPECVEDAKAAVRWLRLNADRYQIDPERIAVSGHSAGGYISVMLGSTAGEATLEGTENPGARSDVQAAVSVYGPVDLGAYRGTRVGPLRRCLARILFRGFLGGKGEDGRDPFDLASPLSYLDAGCSPTLFLHGDRDRIVPIESALDLHAALVEREIATEFVTMEGRGHGFEMFRPRMRRETFEVLWAFLDEHMGMAPRE